METAIEQRGAFSTTHRSIVHRAARDDPALAAVALEQLCRIFCYQGIGSDQRRGEVSFASATEPYGGLLREEVARTVETSADLDEEIRHLCVVMAN
jgi:hypothetical protein